MKEEIPAADVRFKDLVLRINEAFIASGIQPVPSVERISFPVEAGCLMHIVTVGGNVQTPKELPLRQGMTLMVAIDIAGGFSSMADIGTVKLIRAKQETIYDLRIQKPDGSNNPVLMEGDEIVVPGIPATEERAKALLEPGDAVLLAIGSIDPISTAYGISERGLMKLPLLETNIEAAGITVDALIQRINEAYQIKGISGVTVSSSKPKSSNGKFKLGRGTGQPKEYPLRAGTPLLRAIDQTGGMDGKVRKIKLLRGGKELIFDVRKMNSDGSGNPILMDGDEIVVPGG